MKFKAKLRKIGNSQGIYIPLKVITGYNLGEDIELEVITKGYIEFNGTKVITEKAPKVITPDKKVITRDLSRYEMCPKHPGSMKITCGCK